MNDDYVLIVGGAGYIGSHTNLELFNREYKTIVFDSLVYGHKELVKWGEFIQGDLCSEEELAKVFSNYNIKAVIHFAAYAYVGESVIDPQKYYVNNVVNTLNLLKVMRNHNVNFIVFSSTCSVYGLPNKIPINENHDTNPINPYGNSKLMVEKILSDYNEAYGLKYISLRYFNAAGADPEGKTGEWHNPETHLIPLALEAITRHDKILKVYGSDYDTDDGTCIRDYIHVSDLATAHALALEYLLEGGDSDIFNLGNDNGYSVKEIIESVERVTGKILNYQIDDRRPGDPPVLIADSAKIKRELNWSPCFTNIDDTISTAWSWHQCLPDSSGI